MGTYTPIITTAGLALIAESISNGTNINLKYFAWGDGNGYAVTPTVSQTSLVNEVYRQDITSVTIDDNIASWLNILAIVPSTVGNFYVRELGIFTEDGTLFAVGAHPEFYKAIPDEGTAIDFRENITLEIVNLANLTITLTPSLVYVTKGELESHIHDGTSGSPSKILLTGGAQVQGILPSSMLSGVILSDGSIPMSSNLDMTGNELLNISLPSEASSATPRSYIDGLKAGRAIIGLDISNNVTDLNNIIDISSGSCLNSSASILMKNLSSISKNLNSIFVVGSGGGLASNLTKSANTTYHVFAITKADGTFDVGFDTSLSATNLLASPNASGYINYRRIGSIVTDDSSNIIQETRIANNDGSVRVVRKSAIDTLTSSSLSTNYATLTLPTPSGIQVKSILRVLYSALASATSNIYVKSNVTSEEVDCCYIYGNTSSTTILYTDSRIAVDVDTLGQVQHKASVTNTQTLTIKLCEYTDNRMI